MIKQEYRKNLVKAMSMVAEQIQYFHGLNRAYTGILFIGDSPMPFKPGTSDKLIFNRIIDKTLDIIIEDNKTDDINDNMIAVHLMSKFYYPYFEKFDRDQAHNLDARRYYE